MAGVFPIYVMMSSTGWWNAKAAQPADGSFAWRDAISILGIALPLLFGLILYLVRKKQEAENALRVQQITELKDAIKASRAAADTALSKLEEHIRVFLQHQTGCAGSFVKDTVYKKDVETQRQHVAAMTNTIDTLNSMLVQQQQMVTQLLKVLS